MTSVVLGVSCLHSSRQQKLSLIEQANEMGSAMATATAVFSISAMLTADYPLLDSHAETLVENQRDVVLVRIIRADEQVVTEYPSARSDAFPESTTMRVFRSSIEVDRGFGAPLGRVEVGISNVWLDHQLALYASQNLASSVLVFVIIAGLLLFSIQRDVIRPLGILDQYAQGLGQGDLDTPVHLPRVDELGHLARTLDTMRINLRDADREVRDQNVRLRHMDSLKSAFLANMSHELRTPLTAILGNAELIQGTSSDSSEAGECLDSIQRNSRALLSIISNILDLSKIDAGRLEMEFQRCSPARVLKDLQQVFAQQLASKQLDFEFEVASNVPDHIVSDPTRLSQILRNLLDNAIKFTSEGKVSIRVHVTPVAGELQVAFDVRDTGIGLTQEQIERIFEPFTQADSSMTRRFGGTGLGLTISRRLTARLGGTLVVKSEEGRGSLFRLTIPRVPDDWNEEELPQQDESASGPPQFPTLRGRALIVDDCSDNRRLVQMILERAGLEVVLDADGAAATNRLIIERERFDLILLDMHMPIKDGYTAAREIRQAGIDTPIVAITASATTSDRDLCLRAGCVAFVGKPFAPKDLVAVVGSLLPNQA